MSHATLRRYTKLAVALHALRAKVLTLLSPERWEDKNDIAYLRCYQEQLGARAVLALCFADAPEKYHHWKIYSGRLSCKAYVGALSDTENSKKRNGFAPMWSSFRL